MKSKLLILSIVLLSIFGACKRLDNLVSFNLDTNDQVVWLQAPDSLLTDTFPSNQFLTYVSEDFSFNNYDKFAQNKSTSATVENVEGIDLTVIIDSGAVDFSFAKDLKFYISSPSGGYQDELLMEEDFPEPGKDFIQFTLRPTNETLLNIVRRDKYRFRTDFELVAPMTDTLYLSYKLRFRLKAQPVED